MCYILLLPLAVSCCIYAFSGFYKLSGLDSLTQYSSCKKWNYKLRLSDSYCWLLSFAHVIFPKYFKWKDELIQLVL